MILFVYCLFKSEAPAGRAGPVPQTVPSGYVGGVAPSRLILLSRSEAR